MGGRDASALELEEEVLVVVVLLEQSGNQFFAMLPNATSCRGQDSASHRERMRTHDVVVVCVVDVVVVCTSD